jgi:hypothetical protein
MQYLYDIFASVGKPVVLGNLYLNNSTLEKHADNIKNSNSAYTLKKNTKGEWVNNTYKSIQNAILNDAWDIITVQQAIGDAGVPSTYEPLDAILQFLELRKVSSETRILWNMTWAYPKNSTEKPFENNYGKDQMVMYNAIISTIQSEVLTKPSISGVIPTGTAIQNLRTSYLGDTLNRDKQYLSEDVGRYTAALTWFYYLTGISPDKVTWVPEDYSNIKDHFIVIHEAVVNAVKNPYEVTQSKYTTKQ